MNEYSRSQQLRYMAYNLIAFTLIFGLFAGIIYLQIRQSLFSRIDEDLFEAKAAIEKMPDFVDHQINADYDKGKGKDGYGGPGEAAQRDSLPEPPPQDEVFDAFPDGEPPKDPGGPNNNRIYAFVSTRVQMVVRNESGEVLNGHMLGRLYWDDILSEVPFDGNSGEAVESFRLADESYYHSLTFAHTDESGAVHYIQLLANADGEQGIIDSFLQILIVCVLFFVLMSLIASYVLSRKNMDPIMRSWRRQIEFVENASHELRTPLTIIQNKLESLLTTPDATVLDKADNIVISLSETRRLSKLTGDLMTLARADSNDVQLQKEKFSLDAMIEDVCVPYKELAGAQEKTLTLKLGYGGAVGADRGRMHELMVILLDNALKYTREGDSIEIATALRDNKAVISVADTGIGVSEEAMKRIFNRFYREDKARSREKGGTGLGLSIAQWIVDSHGGAIKVMKNEPAGTVFEVRLPR